MPNELGLFYVALLTVRLYIQSDQFSIVQVTVTTLYHQVPSGFILVLKSLHMNLLNIVTLLILRVVLGDLPTRLKNNIDYLQNNIVNINPHTDMNSVVPTVILISKINLSQLIHQNFCHVYVTRLKIIARKGLM